MSWLSDRQIQYLYREPSGEEIILDWPASMDDDSIPTLWELAGRVYQRIRMLPDKTNLVFKTTFERNGTVGYKYDSGNGRPRVVSATRENYEHNMGNTSGATLREMKAKGRISDASPSITTKGYKEAFKKVQAKKGVR